MDRSFMSPVPRIVVVGSVNRDIVVTTPRLPAPGETVTGNSLAETLGGKGANQAIAAAKAGAHVAFVGAVGDDEAGPALRARLSAAGLDLTRLRTAPGSSGSAVIYVDAAAENCIVVIPGANHAWPALEAADLELIATADLLLLQLEIPLEVVIQVAAVAAGHGVPVLLNPSPVQPLPAELLRSVSILVMNEVEAGVVGETAVPCVIVTHGARGAYYRADGRDGTVAAPSVRAVDTTGAGDTFAGALAVARAEGQDITSAVRFACAAGALSVASAGASTSSPPRAAIDDLVRQTYAQL
jgi:ribokinase